MRDVTELPTHAVEAVGPIELTVLSSASDTWEVFDGAVFIGYIHLVGVFSDGTPRFVYHLPAERDLPELDITGDWFWALRNLAEAGPAQASLED